MKTVLITGVTGQDGSYLAEQLTNTDSRIIGLVRDEQKANIWRAAQPEVAVEYALWDMCSQHSMEEVLSKYRPAEIYNFAAYSSGAGMYDDAVSIGDVNGLAVTRLLEAIRTVDPNIKFCQASSREIFGAASESPQSEKSVVNPRSPYGAAKLYADSMVQIYRQHYRLIRLLAILFNHESPRRGLDL
ncbi:GDP-mannose 4,6-dehydratase [Candidatus Aalborgicola defluviihabitans]|uniref:GDP-mannose 4,6-dehydratase n=1 Tax=Candidatus Aalborgicola defluviihabitans TaxID=3386187 RepID=UPI0039B94A37